METQYCNIGLSSMSLWLYLNGNTKRKYRARTDADGNVFYKGIKKTEGGETAPMEPKNYLKFSDKHIFKIRQGWNDFLEDDSFYGDLKPTPTTQVWFNIREEGAGGDGSRLGGTKEIHECKVCGKGYDTYDDLYHHYDLNHN